MLFRSNDTATTEIYTVPYTLSLHDALPIWAASGPVAAGVVAATAAFVAVTARRARKLARCVQRCKGLVLDLPGNVSVTVAWGPTCNSA